MGELATLFARQREISSALIAAAGLSKDDALRSTMLALTAEVGELIQSLQGNWKWWKDIETVAGAPQSELVDVFLFTILMAVELDVDAEELLRASHARLDVLARGKET